MTPRMPRGEAKLQSVLQNPAIPWLAAEPNDLWMGNKMGMMQLVMKIRSNSVLHDYSRLMIMRDVDFNKFKHALKILKNEDNIDLFDRWQWLLMKHIHIKKGNEQAVIVIKINYN